MAGRESSEKVSLIYLLSSLDLYEGPEGHPWRVSSLRLSSPLASPPEAPVHFGCSSTSGPLRSDATSIFTLHIEENYSSPLASSIKHLCLFIIKCEAGLLANISPEL